MPSHGKKTAMKTGSDNRQKSLLYGVLGGPNRGSVSLGDLGKKKTEEMEGGTRGTEEKRLQLKCFDRIDTHP